MAKLSFVMASVLAMGMGLTACSKQETAHHATEDIAAEQGEIARANNPAPAAKEPATPVATPAPASATATATASTATTETATATATASAPAAETATATASDAGEKLYGQTCKACHDAGLLGAPKPGDKENWKPRIAQGKDTLYKHAIEGFTGKTGAMPAKGGSAASDDEVKAAVDYMVAKSS